MKIGDKVHITAAINAFVQSVGMKKKKKNPNCRTATVSTTSLAGRKRIAH